MQLLTRWSLVSRAALIVVAVALVFVAQGQYETSYAESGETFTFPLLRWFFASGMAALAGVAIGIASRSRPPAGPFRIGVVAALGAVPLFLAMSYPIFTRGWLGLDLSPSPFWRERFLELGLTAMMWLFVGVAVAAGFSGRAGRPTE